MSTTYPVRSTETLTQLDSAKPVLISDDARTGRLLHLSTQGVAALATLKSGLGDRQFAFHLLLEPNVREGAYNIVGLKASRLAKDVDTRGLDAVLADAGQPREVAEKPQSSILFVPDAAAVYNADQLDVILKAFTARAQQRGA